MRRRSKIALAASGVVFTAVAMRTIRKRRHGETAEHVEPVHS